MLKEEFYINLERENDSRFQQSTYDGEVAVPTEDKLTSQFEPRRFPKRECRPVVRRRSLAELWALIEE